MLEQRRFPGVQTVKDAGLEQLSSVFKLGTSRNRRPPRLRACTAPLSRGVRRCRHTGTPELSQPLSQPLVQPRTLRSFFEFRSLVLPFFFCFVSIEIYAPHRRGNTARALLAPRSLPQRNNIRQLRIDLLRENVQKKHEKNKLHNASSDTPSPEMS